MAERAIVVLYIPAGDRFDPVIAALVNQCRAGHPVRILRADGVTVELSVNPDRPMGDPIINMSPAEAWREPEAKG